MLLKQIRSSFLDFFKNNEHEILPSSPLLPHNDPSIMFVNSGMVQFKNIFTGKESPKYKKVATAQKCMRAGGKHNDLDNVGHTARHHTFFEMLGNFSFGDYSKERAIELAWSYLTKVLLLPKDKLYITVYRKDEEAANIWRKLTGFSQDKIIKISTSDNFWSMGDIGPCGPCSEIFYDHGEKIKGNLPGSGKEEGDRYVEIWNLVFMQYEILKNGNRIPLPKPCIDTGMGLERIAAIMQGVHDNYDIDLFRTLINKSKKIIGYQEEIVMHKIISDHLRSSAFLIADGITPSNEGRGYVLRKIIRRAIGSAPDSKIIPIHLLLPTLLHEMANTYPELTKAEALITSTLKQEEEQYQDILTKGLGLFNKATEKIGNNKIIPGKIAFMLYDTHGIPLDMIIQLTKSRNYILDQKGFNEEMRNQKERAKLAWSGSGEKADDSLWLKLYEKFGPTTYIRDNLLLNSDQLNNKSPISAKVIAIVQNGSEVKEVSTDDAILILDKTPFYAESGGQIGDTGQIAENRVFDTKLFARKIHGHYTHINNPIKIGDTVKCIIDQNSRQKIARNHSATHLLHFVLRKNLGTSVTQKGSLVAVDKFRFDFSFSRALSTAEIAKTEKDVNNLIESNAEVTTEIKSLKESQEDTSIISLFGEKYDDKVRVVSMGNSKELCGGTHVGHISEIGGFKITKEESIAAGIRRIEARTGYEAIKYLESEIEKINQELTQNIEQNKEIKKELESLHLEILSEKVEKKIIKGVTFIHKIYDQKDSVKTLKQIIDELRKKHQNSIIALIALNQDKINLSIAVTKDLSNRYKANELLKKCFDLIDGKGGGNPEVAQAGGKNIQNAEKIITNIYSNI